jgi:hypothetical protein
MNILPANIGYTKGVSISGDLTAAPAGKALTFEGAYTLPTGIRRANGKGGYRPAMVCIWCTSASARRDV